MKIEDLDPTLMLHPALNQIVHLSTAHFEGLAERTRLVRARLSATCLYHGVLAELFDETSKVQMVKGKPAYPKRSYLGNVEVEYLPDRHAWKVTISNGGLKRKNARVPYKLKEVLHVRRIGGIYIVDEDFECKPRCLKGRK